LKDFDSPMILPYIRLYLYLVKCLFHSLFAILYFAIIVFQTSKWLARSAHAAKIIKIAKIVV